VHGPMAHHKLVSRLLPKMRVRTFTDSSPCGRKAVLVLLTVGGKRMLKMVRCLVICALVLLPGILLAGERFDGKWLTKMSCPAKGNTEGYT